MKYFVENKFEQKSGAIGNTSTVFTNKDTALMEYHSVLASQYTPENLATLVWADVNIYDNFGNNLIHEHIEIHAQD